MAAYLTKRLIVGTIKYSIIFSSEYFKPYQAETEAILIAKGRQDLIVPVT